jgi:hypothetical protein
MANTILSQAQITEIRAIIRTVTDQFYVTPITYYLRDARPDRWGNKATGQGTETELLAMVEFPTDLKDFAKEMEAGVLPSNSVKITMNMDYLEEKGLINAEDGTHIFEEGDFFETQGKSYKVLFAGYDGPLEQKNVLAIIIGEVRV